MILLLTLIGTYKVISANIQIIKLLACLLIFIITEELATTNIIISLLTLLKSISFFQIRYYSNYIFIRYIIL